MRELVPRVQKLRALAGNESDMGGWALRFAISHDAISMAIPGGRTAQQVERNCAASDKGRLPAEQVAAVHKWWQQDTYLRELRTEL